jgi:DNA-directed RNA polymerase subunit K/omega
MSDEDILDEQPEQFNVGGIEGEDSGSDIDEPIDIENNIIDNVEDINVFNFNYNKLKSTNKSSKVLSKYEKTKILSKRCEQLESGCQPLIEDYEKYNNIYDIALKELNERKIPFILKRFIDNKYEYWKLDDLIY